MGYSFVPVLVRLWLGVLLTAVVACFPASAAARVVRYHGHTLEVPRGWPVYNLSAQPLTCVRFDRHAVYLGTPSSRQRCPAAAIGRTEAVLIDAGGRVSASWNRHPDVIRHVLGVSSLPPEPSMLRPSGPRARIAAAARAGSKALAAGAVYTGLGFDVCSAPSAAQMSAWSGTSYRAVGIYIGGVNSACAQPNLNAAWVSAEETAGWHLIPTYVGLQAPNGSCSSCGAINPSHAAAQGTAAATDAVTQAQALGIGPGNPIYYDMEAYARGGTTTTAVLSYLAAWTEQLHASGYLSGVYSSAASGISDLVSQYGTTYAEPDDLWIADWDGRQTTSDPYVPAADWANHQRLRQYSGGHDETHGGVRLNIDGDYLDASTAGLSTAPAAPSLSVKPVADGSVALSPSWPGTSGIVAWQVLAGQSASGLSPLGAPIQGGAGATFEVHSQFSYYGAEALDAGGNALGTSTPVAIAPHLAIYGHSSFVPARGYAGIPVGCFIGATCHVTVTLSAGATTVATGGSQHVAAGTGGLVFVSLTSAGRSLLSHAHRLAVSAVVRDVSGVRAATNLNLVPFSTHGKAPPRDLISGSTLRVVGATDFVYRGVTGGILAACSGAAPCRVTTAILAGRTTIATAGPQFLGANELGYLSFRLTAAGRALLAAAPGNQLGVHVALADGSAVAGGQIVLVAFR